MLSGEERAMVRRCFNVQTTSPVYQNGSRRKVPERADATMLAMGWKPLWSRLSVATKADPVVEQSVSIGENSVFFLVSFRNSADR